MTAPDTSAHGDVGTGGTIIHRKAQVGKAEHQARAMSLAKALRLTLARVSDDLFDMSMAVIGVRTEKCAGDDLSGKLSDPGLLMLLDGPARSRAAAVFDPTLVGALIQQQTMGKVLKDTGDSARAMTPTDAAVCAPFLNAVLERAAPLPEDTDDQRLIAGYRFGAWVEDARVLGMALEAADYQVVQVQLDIAGGLRQGRLLLCMPQAEALSETLDAPSSIESGMQGAAVQQPSEILSETVQNLKAELRISLVQLKMPLRAVGALEVGS
ncbi:MAG: flagellar motor switch protein FliM, partial [Sulfitobacter sp.]|nr:flagellar motor switch protein FliM [Sulfitobacter sp.]